MYPQDSTQPAELPQLVEHPLPVRLFQNIVSEHLSNVGVEDSPVKVVSHMASVVHSCNL